jgi:hypothetical protein
MRAASRICMALGTFLLVAGIVYALTSHETVGSTLLLVSAATFWFLGLVLRSLAGESDDGADAAAEEIHVAPTIWPFGFAIAAVLLALGLIVTPWIVILGAAAFALASAGWLRDVARSHGHGG